MIAAARRWQTGIRRLLIANRGEIAVRILRSCRDLGITSVQAFSEADRDSLAVKTADEAICIGPAAAQASYLNGRALVGAAILAGCDAVHPGYGFLSENAAFAARCIQHGLIFVGPRPEIIRQMGDKAEARRIAREAGVPVVPGSAVLTSDADAQRAAEEIGFPVLIKASAGGGGRGMRVAKDTDELRAALPVAQREAASAFGDNSVYCEKYLADIRHVEVQILADGDRAIHLGERDCTIQRRHQKIVEEAPSPALSEPVRSAVLDCALRLARHVKYSSVGTVEFVFDNLTGKFYFIEMNTRIQVEHPVTELVTGIDLINQQLLIAGGQGLALRQDEVTFTGHAIECRINAEDEARDFMPDPGTLTRVEMPSGPDIRVDTHVYSGYEVPPYYDSLLAKVIVKGATRADALMRMSCALDKLRLEGVSSNVSLQMRLLGDATFVAGRINTVFLGEFLRRQVATPQIGQRPEVEIGCQLKGHP
jgi:acetyl-CoA carboxylase biotin carboxylase subunit